MGTGTDARRARHRQPDVPVAGHLRVTGVDAHPHLDLRAVRPAVLGDHPLSRRCRLDRIPRPREGDEERLGLAVDDDAAMLGERGLQQATVLRDHLLVPLTKAVLELCRTLDVGEQKGHRALWQLAHVSILTARSAIGKARFGR